MKQKNFYEQPLCDVVGMSVLQVIASSPMDFDLLPGFSGYGDETDWDK